MVYARPKYPLRDTGGTGIILDIAWYREDPGDDPDKLVNADFNGAALIYAPSISAVTPEMIDDAIEEARPQAEAELNPPNVQPPSATRAMLGKVYDAGQISQRVQQRRAVRGGRS